jgi:hypothetical protein
MERTEQWVGLGWVGLGWVGYVGHYVPICGHVVGSFRYENYQLRDLSGLRGVARASN